MIPLLAAALLAACHPRPMEGGSGAGAGEVARPSDGAGSERVVGPDVWARGVAVPLPPGWIAEEEPPAVVAITDPDTGAVLRVLLDQPLPAAREGLLRTFADEDRYRRVPLVAGGGTETWISRDPAGPTTLVWYGTAEGRAVRFELEAPEHALYAALERFQPLLAAAAIP